MSLDDRQLGAVERWTLILAGAMLVSAYFALSRMQLLGVSIGAALMCLNAWALRRIGTRVVENRTRVGVAVLLFNVKMAALVGVIYLCIRYLHIEPIGFLVGISVFPLAVVIAAIQLGMAARQEPDGKETSR